MSSSVFGVAGRLLRLRGGECRADRRSSPHRRHFRGAATLMARAPQPARDGSDNFYITRTPTQVSRMFMPDVAARRRRRSRLRSSVATIISSGHAKAALDRARIDERLLHRPRVRRRCPMPSTVVTVRPPPVTARHRHARDRRAVDQDRAATAYALIASALRARKAAVLRAARRAVV